MTDKDKHARIMFNQRKNSIRRKSETIPTSDATTSTCPTTPPTSTTTKGLLSFNTSNFTKLFKNSTNFVQSTFGNATNVSGQSQTTSPIQTQSIAKEPEFIIPSMKKRPIPAACTNGITRNERNTIGAMVVKQPVSVTNSSPNSMTNSLALQQKGYNSQLANSSTIASATKPLHSTNGYTSSVTMAKQKIPPSDNRIKIAKHINENDSMELPTSDAMKTYHIQDNPTSDPNKSILPTDKNSKSEKVNRLDGASTKILGNDTSMMIMNCVRNRFDTNQLQSQDKALITNDNDKNYLHAMELSTTQNVKKINDNYVSGDSETPFKNNNRLNKMCADTNASQKTMSNNNLDYHLNHCINIAHQATGTTFKPLAKPLDTAIQPYHTVDNTIIAENLHANCVKIPLNNASELDNYQQQSDTNENFMEASDGQNNNYRISINAYGHMTDNSNETIKYDQSNMGSVTEQQQIMTNNNDSEHNDETSDKPSPIFTLTNSNQNLIVPATNELYDILEEPDDDAYGTPLQYRRWSSTCSLYDSQLQRPSTTQTTPPPPPLSSFAAAVSFANELQDPRANRNPFLQLIASKLMNEANGGTMAQQSSSSSSFVTATSQQYDTNVNDIMAPIISSVFNNNTNQNDISTAYSSSNQCSIAFTAYTSHCATTYSDLSATPAPYKMPSDAQLQLQLQATDYSQSNSMALNSFFDTNRYCGDAVDSMLLTLKEHDNQYIRQFMQVMPFALKALSYCRVYEMAILDYILGCAMLVESAILWVSFAFSIFIAFFLVFLDSSSLSILLDSLLLSIFLDSSSPSMAILKPRVYYIFFGFNAKSVNLKH